MNYMFDGASAFNGILVSLDNDLSLLEIPWAGTKAHATVDTDANAGILIRLSSSSDVSLTRVNH